MDVEQRYLFRQVASDGRAVVDIHELGGDQPDRKPLFLHPVVAQEQEIAVETGKSAHLQPQGLRQLRL